MTVELFADDSNKKMTKLVVNGKKINLKKCLDFSVTINANADNFITISARRYG